MATIAKWKPKRAVFTAAAGWMPVGYWQVGLPQYDSVTGKWWIVYQNTTTVKIADWITGAILITINSAGLNVVLLGDVVVSAGLLYIVTGTVSGSDFVGRLNEIDTTTAVKTVRTTFTFTGGMSPGTAQTVYGSVTTDGTYVFAAFGLYRNSGSSGLNPPFDIHSRIVRMTISDHTILTLVSETNDTITGTVRSFGPLGVSGAFVYFLKAGTGFRKVSTGGGAHSSASALTVSASGFKGWHVCNASGVITLKNADESVSVSLGTIGATDTVYTVFATDEVTPSIHHMLSRVFLTGVFSWTNTNESGTPVLVGPSQSAVFLLPMMMPLRGRGVGFGGATAWTELTTLSKEVA